MDDSGGGSFVFSSGGESDIGFSYGIGFIIFVFLIIIAYAIYKYNRMRRANSLQSVENNININTNNLQLMTITRGVEDDVLMTLPAFVYSEDTMPNKGINTDGSGCSICLADYKAKDVIRLLPACGHLFHIECVDTWLKVHPNCPVCRKSVTASPGQTLLNGQQNNPMQAS